MVFPAVSCESFLLSCWAIVKWCNILVYPKSAIDELQEMLGAESDSDDEDDGSESDEETPKKVCFNPNLTNICSSLFENL